MKKISSNLFIKIQSLRKKKIVLTLLLSLTAFALLVACDKPNPPNGGTTNPQDTIEHEISYWECIMEDANPYYHVEISLSVNHTINRIYSTVTSTPMSTVIMWETGWIDYVISNDTLYYLKEYHQYFDDTYNYDEPYPMWIITSFTDTNILLEANRTGINPDLRFDSYLFNRKK